MTGITKTFPGVIANEDASLAVPETSIHAVVGENGAGKSTLMKILYGMQAPDSGTMAVHGKQVHFRSPKDAIAERIGMVHQHFMLADNLTVLENIVLGDEPRRGLELNFSAARAKIKELGDAYGIPLNPDELVEVRIGDQRIGPDAPRMLSFPGVLDPADITPSHTFDNLDQDGPGGPDPDSDARSRLPGRESGDGEDSRGNGSILRGGGIGRGPLRERRWPPPG